MPKPPVDGDYFDKVNYVIDAWADACEAPWYIYVETMKPAALEAFIVLITFGWDDVLRGIFRPGGLGRRSMKRKGRWARKIPRFPELGETIGKGLPVADQIEDFVKWGTKTRFLWRIDTAIQLALFAWLVVDVTVDFAFNWTSLLYETRWCRDSDLGRFSYHSPGEATLPGGAWWKMGFSVQDYSHPLPSWLLVTGHAGAAGCQAACGMSFAPAFGAPASECAIRIRHDTTGKLYAQAGPSPVNQDLKLTMAVGASIPPNAHFRVETWHNGSWAKVGLGAVTAHENPS